MNTDQMKGSVKGATGKTQRKIGEAVGSKSQQAKGTQKEVEGKAQKAFGDAKETLKDSPRHH